MSRIVSAATPDEEFRKSSGASEPRTQAIIRARLGEFMNRVRFRAGLIILVLVGHAGVPAATARPCVSGTSSTQLGARLAGATVTLLRESATAGDNKSGSDGTLIYGPCADRYRCRPHAWLRRSRARRRLRRRAAAWSPSRWRSAIGPLQQDVVVTAGRPRRAPVQTGAPVTVIDEQTLEALNKPDLLEALRLVPGAQIAQIGRRGGRRRSSSAAATPTSTRCWSTASRPTTSAAASTSRSCRPPASSASKCCARPTASSTAATRWPASSTSPRGAGSTRVPEVELTPIDGGNLGTFRTDASIGGAVKRVDYFSAVLATSRPTTTCPTTTTGTALTPAGSAWRWAAAPT